MELRFTVSFQKDYRNLSGGLQKVLDKKLSLFLENPRHPSLQVKKMDGFESIYEARFTKGHRFTFQKKEMTYLIRRAGPHDILRHP